MTTDPHDAIWAETHDLLYNTTYTAELEKSLLARWTWLDNITKIAVAISSGGAALAGLVFWKNADYTFLWPVFTSASALLAIVSRQLAVAEKIRRHATSAANLTALTLDVGTMIVRMKINAEFSVNEFEKKLLALRDKYGIEARKLHYDVLLTEGLRVGTQEKLDASLKIAQRQ